MGTQFSSTSVPSHSLNGSVTVTRPCGIEIPWGFQSLLTSRAKAFDAMVPRAAGNSVRYLLSSMYSISFSSQPALFPPHDRSCVSCTASDSVKFGAVFPLCPIKSGFEQVTGPCMLEAFRQRSACRAQGNPCHCLLEVSLASSESHTHTGRENRWPSSHSEQVGHASSKRACRRQSQGQRQDRHVKGKRGYTAGAWRPWLGVTAPSRSLGLPAGGGEGAKGRAHNLELAFCLHAGSACS